MAHPEVEKNLKLAMEHLHAGRLSEAENLYQSILSVEPRHPVALHLLGLISHRMRRYGQAVELIQRALAIAPNWPEALFNLAIVLKDAGRIDESIAAAQQAILLKADYPEALGNLGNLFSARGRHREAIEAYRRVVNLRPGWHEAHSNLGVAFRQDRQIDPAISAFRTAISLNDGHPETFNNLGNALRDKGQLNESIAAYQKAIALRADFPEAVNNLGAALKDAGNFSGAIGAFRRAIALLPGFSQAWNNLGVSLDKNGELDRAITAYQKAIAINADYAEAWHNLGNALKDQGRLNESIAAYRRAIAINPGFLEAHNNLVYLLHFHPAYDAEAIADELGYWKERHADPLSKPAELQCRDIASTGRLRIGYVSPDFCQHPVGRFLLPLLANHNRDQFEIIAYSHGKYHDGVTEELRRCTDTWRDISSLTDDEAADLIRRDRIDILIDLTMHMAHNRLLLFARRCAPVQATYLAYCSTTGLDTIDFRISDPHLDAPGSDTSVYSEKTIRLPETYWCYQPGNSSPEVNGLPAGENGPITFGCLNNFAKICRPVIETWASLLRTVPDSQLLLSARPGGHRARLLAEFHQLGIDPSRVTFSDKLALPAYFRLYHRIDIALDTFPYAGGTTTFDALWMGVPVVSLAGNTAVGRGGLSILTNIGLPEQVATSTGEYVQIAVGLAADRAWLGELRRTLRARMQESPLLDTRRFAGNFEQACRQMCAQEIPMKA
jgi:predicted O-linked N-acetylglucosamine transferase (SPINDLY family)